MTEPHLAVVLLMILDDEDQEARVALEKTTTSRRMIRGEMVSVPIRPPSWRIALWTPERVLAELEAKRRIITRCQEEMLSGTPRLVHFAKQTLIELAHPYADHPAFMEDRRG